MAASAAGTRDEAMTKEQLGERFLSPSPCLLCTHILPATVVVVEAV
jgi:hypothetical protein